MPIFQIKGGLYPLTVLQLLETDLDDFEKQLETKLKQAPKFFYHAPVVIDLQKLDNLSELDFKKLHPILLAHHLIPVGIKGANATAQSLAIAAGFAILQEQTTKTAETTKTQASIDTSSPPATLNNHTKVISEPVRSGQQIYAQGGDLIILGAVSHGAELLADGHIHIYGPLRGRALAGITGDTRARIFCQSLEAELISVAGQYKISEDIEKIAWRVTANISLEGEHLHIATF